MALIALVMVVTMVDGQRREFQPGEEVTGLHAHDVEQLKKMGSLQDTVEVAAAEKAAVAEQKKAGKAFDEVKKARAAAKESAADAESKPAPAPVDLNQ